MTSTSEILKKARDCERKGDYEGAACEYRALAQTEPCPPIAYNLLGDLYHRKGEHDEAARWYQKSVERYAQESLYGNAIGVCRKILRQYPHRVQAIEQLGGLFFSQGLAREAVKHYMVFAARMAEMGDGEAVLRTGTRIREILAGDPEVRERLGEIFLALSLPDEGIVDLRAALNGYRERSLIADADRVAQRLHELERSRPIDPLALMENGAADTPLAFDPALLAGSPFEPEGFIPGEPPAASGLQPEATVAGDEEKPLCGEFLVGAGEETGEALAGELEDAAPASHAPEEPAGSAPGPLEGFPEDVEVLSPGRVSPSAEGSPGKGRDPFESPSGEEDFVPVREILREFQNGVSRIIGAGDFQSHYDMGMSYKEMGLYEEALREFELASRSPELSASCEEMQADVLIELGRYEECAHLLRGLVARDENDGVGIHFLLGLAYEKLGESELALREYRLVEERDPDFRDVRSRIAQF